MKLHPGLLALGLLVFAALACSIGNTNTGNSGTSNTNGNTAASNTSGGSTDTSGVHIDELYVAKEEDGEKVTTFSPSDRTVYAVATLSEFKADTKVKITWYAVDVNGQSKNTKLKDIEITTGSFENKITAHLTFPQDWPKGKYRVEAEVNGKPGKSVEYTVE